ncbi:pentapeptide repeat-containing protein [Streptomyces scabiei]|uniref:pentapeptide repeat-containing protein n=1 Tax=Streptomyces scabiei TaxID=1930 RepID=UPI002FF1D4F3
MITQLRRMRKLRGRTRGRRLAVGVAILLGLIGYALLLWKGPWWLDGSHIRERDLQPADGVVITGLRTMLVALGAAVVAGLGLMYTHLNLQHTRDRDREQAELTLEGQVTERYVEAIKLLGSDNETERLGGIYALERIMKDSEKDHWTVVEVLASFVRNHCERQDDTHIVEADGEHGTLTVSNPPTRDGVVAFEVLCRRPDRPEAHRVDLRNVTLHEVHIEGGRLQDFDLSEADLRNATFIDCNLESARLNRAVLEEATLATCNLSKVTFDGASLAGARLHNVSLEKTSFRSAQMARTRIDEASMEQADLREAEIADVLFSDVSMHEARFEGATLLGNTEFRNAAGLTPEQFAPAAVAPGTELPAAIARVLNLRSEIESLPRRTLGHEDH